MRKIILLFTLLNCLIITACSNENKNVSTVNTIRLHKFSPIDENTLKTGTKDSDFLIYDYSFSKDISEKIYEIRFYYEIKENDMTIISDYAYMDNTNIADEVPISNIDTFSECFLLQYRTDSYVRHSSSRNKKDIEEPIVVLCFNDLFTDSLETWERDRPLLRENFKNIDRETIQLKEKKFVDKIDNFESSIVYDLGYFVLSDTFGNEIKIDLKTEIITDFKKTTSYTEYIENH